ncbi:histidine phosphotransferase family protein [Bartonella sp. TP]|uniref:histidine phosphotransferase family protein n=1 Tax=Bartonella sp. TP TaxID=3057550 RepID=UPI0025AFAAE7|nr:histidine phosphotransferase family protein [Bartonella sp. TP]MDN5249423.1 histidine phosphotransferase family protein [Alphaproteobacteria bacterium]WJW79709.1 histidine phosphotransferase family protein [Bartonella sp. TP]
MTNTTLPLPPLTETLTATELSAYLTSKLCHDLISPISALNNAIELSEDDGFQSDIVELLQQSAIKATHKLQFYRLAFGAYGGAESQIDLTEAQQVALHYMQHEKANLNWSELPENLSKFAIKLLLNLICITNKMLPRGGEIVATLFNNTRSPQSEVFILEAKAEHIQIPSYLTAMAFGKLNSSEINAHNIQTYYSLLLAEQAHIELTLKHSETQLIIIATYR